MLPSEALTVSFTLALLGCYSALLLLETICNHIKAQTEADIRPSEVVIKSGWCGSSTCVREEREIMANWGDSDADEVNRCFSGTLLGRHVTQTLTVSSSHISL